MSEKNYLKQKVNPITQIILIGAIAAGLIYFTGNYHIVPGTGQILIKRPYFGFSDIIGDARMCTDIPYIIAISQHPSLCRALIDSGDISNSLNK